MTETTVPVGTVIMTCPECPAELPVTVTGVLTTDDEGRQFLRCDPDMSDLWAHAWTHA